MCIIAVLPKGKTISRDEFAACWDRNHDGGGIMYAVRGRVQTHKGFATESAMWAAYQKIRSSHKGTIALHFRIATSGGINEKMCHPFTVGEYAVMHNGVLSGLGAERRSDTCVLAQDVLGKLPDGWAVNRGTLRLLECYMRSERSKLVVMRPNGEAVIVNESAGQWDKGRWFSNDSYRPPMRSTWRRETLWGEDDVILPARVRLQMRAKDTVNPNWQRRCVACGAWKPGREMEHVEGMGLTCESCQEQLEALNA